MLPGEAGLEPAALAPLGARIGVTLPLALLALVIALAVGPAAGYGAAAARLPAARGVFGLVTRLLLAAPSFWLGLVLVLVVVGPFQRPLPGGFMPWQENAFGALGSLLLPALALSLPLAAALGRQVEREIAALDGSPELFAARAGGMTTAEARRRLAVRVLPGIAQRAGQRFGLLLAGAMIIEPVFYLPGLGRLLFDAVAAEDRSTLVAALIVLIALTGLGRWLGDVAARHLDPRPAGQRA
jgi:peptide/nickel transport system permease protein